MHGSPRSGPPCIRLRNETVTDDLGLYARRALAGVADADKAGPMAVYMKTTMPFYGVPSPLRRAIARSIYDRFPPADADQYRANVLALWNLDHREEKYLALDFAIRFKRFVTLAQIELYERMITEGAWWDFVDAIASHLVGKVVGDDRLRMGSILKEWIDHDDLWLRRTAILCQLRHKEETDEAMLFDFCLRRAHEKEFFIRKAIGWALREYSKSEPEAVREFLVANRGQLSSLTIREASKHL